MSKPKKKLNILLTCSMQNDFIEPIDDLTQSDDKLKLDYLIKLIKEINEQNLSYSF